MRRAWLVVLLAGCGPAQPKPEPDPEGAFPVRVVYLIPSDQERFAEYERAIPRCVEEVRLWYIATARLGFKALPLEVIQAKEDYLTMKCGAEEAERAEGVKDPMRMPAWTGSVERAVGGWKARTATLVFAQGGGGIAQANLQGDFAGWCVVGDWVLEPISGKRNPKGITAAMCPNKVYVTGGTPIGTVAHEIGHAFGAHHPDGYEPGKRSIMRAHWDWPQTGWLDHEKVVLRSSPFTAAVDWDGGAPFADYITADTAIVGKEFVIVGRGFKEGDEVDFTDANGTTRVKSSRVEEAKLVVVVPKVGPGVVRVVRFTAKSNAIPVNIYP